MNYFLPNTAAERYSLGRPNFHSNSIQHIREFLKLTNKFEHALDIACGTGLSTQALLDIAEHVYGTDSSQAMLDLALQKDKIFYQLAESESQPFTEHQFDLITVCSGVHWFDINKFLREANRLLKNKSWLIIYDNFFLGEMKGNLEFKKWYHTVYLKEFPPPIRNDAYEWKKENLLELNLNFVKEEKFDNPIFFNTSELIHYFTTQSNVISKVEKRETTYDHTEFWLHHELSPFFKTQDDRKNFRFGNWIKYLRKS